MSHPVATRPADRPPAVPPSAIRGFTMIELLVVVAVIALLATMLIPVIDMVRTQAQQTSCTTRQRNLVAALLTYSNDHDGYMPAMSHYWGPALYNNYDAGPMGLGLLISGGYIGTYQAGFGTGTFEQLLMCPTLSSANHDDPNWHNYEQGAIAGYSYCVCQPPTADLWWANRPGETRPGWDVATADGHHPAVTACSFAYNHPVGTQLSYTPHRGRTVVTGYDDGAVRGNHQPADGWWPANVAQEDWRGGDQPSFANFWWYANRH